MNKKQKLSDEKIQQERRPREGLSAEAKPDSHTVQGQEKIFERWEEAVNALMNQEFSSLEESVEAVIAHALGDVDAKGSERAEQESFLRGLFEHDPILQKTLRKTFTIRKK